MTSQVSSEPPAVAVKRLRVLFVEDSPVDLELCLRELRKAEYRVMFRA